MKSISAVCKHTDGIKTLDRFIFIFKQYFSLSFQPNVNNYSSIESYMIIVCSTLQPLPFFFYLTNIHIWLQDKNVILTHVPIYQTIEIKEKKKSVFIVQQTKKESTAPSWVLLIILTTDRSWFQRIEVKRRRRRLVNLYRKVCVTQISKRNEIKKARKKNNKKKKVFDFFLQMLES